MCKMDNVHSEWVREPRSCGPFREGSGWGSSFPSASASLGPRLLSWSFGPFDDGPRFEVELHFAADTYLQQYVRERKWHHSQTFEDLSTGELKMTMEVSTMQPLWAWIRSFGKSVKLVKPDMEIPEKWGEAPAVSL